MTVKCSFCPRTPESIDIRTIIGGPQAYICDHCVRLCLKIIIEKEVVDKDATRAQIAADATALADPAIEDALRLYERVQKRAKADS